MKKRTNGLKNTESQRASNEPERIQQRAYELFLGRGQQPGHELDDWLQAEREVNDWRETQKIG